jgi:hypothetical protein
MIINSFEEESGVKLTLFLQLARDIGHKCLMLLHVRTPHLKISEKRKPYIRTNPNWTQENRIYSIEVVANMKTVLKKITSVSLRSAALSRNSFSA